MKTILLLAALLPTFCALPRWNPEEPREARRGMDWAGRSLVNTWSDPWGMGDGAVWIGVGDSVSLQIRDGYCSYDVCGSGHQDPGGTWSVGDSAIVRLRSHEGRGFWRATLSGRAEGRTWVRVSGMTGTVGPPTHLPARRQITADVVIIPAVDRVELDELRVGIRAGDSVTARFRVVGKDGRVIGGVPVTTNVSPEDRNGGSTWITADSVVFVAQPWVPGVRQRLTASFAGRADTVYFIVGPRDRHN